MNDPAPTTALPETLTDDQIVRRVLAGEPALFELVMRRHNRRVFRAVRAILRDDAEAEDVMQEAYVNAFAHLSDFSGRAQLSTWLVRIAVHEAFARLRRGKRLEPLDEMESEVLQMASPARGPEDGASDVELRGILEDAIDQLPTGYRAVFVLRAVEQLSVSETSDVLGIPEETVKTRLHRARGLLQESLVERVGGALPVLFDFHLSRCDCIVAGVLSRIPWGPS